MKYTLIMILHWSIYHCINRTCSCFPFSYREDTVISPAKMILMFLSLLNNDFNFFLCLGIKYNMGFQQSKKVSFWKYIRKIVPIF